MPQTVSFSLLLFLPAGCFGRFGLLTVSPSPCKIRQHFSNPLARRVFFSLMENAPCRFSCRFSHPRLLSIWFSFQYPPAFCPPVFAFSSRCPSGGLVKSPLPANPLTVSLISSAAAFPPSSHLPFPLCLLPPRRPVFRPSGFIFSPAFRAVFRPIFAVPPAFCKIRQPSPNIVHIRPHFPKIDSAAFALCHFPCNTRAIFRGLSCFSVVLRPRFCKIRPSPFAKPPFVILHCSHQRAAAGVCCMALLLFA